MASVNVREVSGGEVTVLKSNHSFLLDDGTNSHYVEWDSIVAALSPEGVLINGVITPTVSSNNLTVAIKTTAGGDPSSTDPVFVKINGTVRSITAACSITLNAATNWFNAGSAELATREIDYFLYAVWDSADSLVRVAPARIPNGSTVNATDFSATTTNEAHLGGYSNYTVGDSVTVIGRFAATLSAGAGYTWTVPTYTSDNLKQYPIWNTRKLLYTPQWASTGTQPALVNGTLVGVYEVWGNKVEGGIWQINGGSTTYGTGVYTWSLPFTSSVLSNFAYVGNARVFDASPTTFYVGVSALSSGGSTISLATHGATGSVGATVPITFTTSDVIGAAFGYHRG